MIGRMAGKWPWKIWAYTRPKSNPNRVHIFGMYCINNTLGQGHVIPYVIAYMTTWMNDIYHTRPNYVSYKQFIFSILRSYSPRNCFDYIVTCQTSDCGISVTRLTNTWSFLTRNTSRQWWIIKQHKNSPSNLIKIRELPIAGHLYLLSLSWWRDACPSIAGDWRRHYAHVSSQQCSTQ